MSDLTIEQASLAPTITAQQAATKVAAGALLIDVRSEGGRTANGPLPGAQVVGKDEVETKFGLDSAERLPGVESTATPIVVVCGSVVGSGPVAASLIASGYTNVVQVEGGFPAWKDAGLLS